jgi:shikimate kinase/3-dehydroquinate synthase
MRHVVLSGLMGTGKSTLGPRIAARLGLPFVDTDDEIVHAAGKSVVDLWKSEGEAGFRAIEARVVGDLLGADAPCVLSFGGGAVTTREVRALALRRAWVVTLDAEPDALVARLADPSSRPHLAGQDVRARLVELRDQRAEAYAECHERVATDRADMEEAVGAIVELCRRAPVVVPLGKRTYVVDVAFDEPKRLTRAVARLSPTRVVTVTDAVIERARGASLDAALAPLGTPSSRVTLASGEIHKRLASIEATWDAAITAGADSASVLVAFGGGVVGDVTGFAASTLFRGVRFVQSPTTLLSMVDASVGGKTGIDLPSGKNLVGTFHQPSAVVCDLAHLATLSARERTAGLAEIVKIGLLDDPWLIERLEEDAAKVSSGDPETLLPIVRRAIEAKARFVAADERDTDVRALLNLGHTVGHALEAHGGFERFLHGEAVAIGMMVELAAAVHIGITPIDVLERVGALLSRLGLPTRATPADVTGAWRHTATDKKRTGGTLRWPVVTRIGEAHVHRVALESLREAVFAGLR